MTRLRRPWGDHRRSPRLGLDEAFRTLGNGPSLYELGWVADILRESGVEVEYDDDLVKLAEANGSSAFVALDLTTTVAFGLQALQRSTPASAPEEAS